MKTGQHLKIKSMGDNVLGVKLEGNKAKPEPIHFRVVLPFGDVDIVRCSDDSYWVHTRINHKKDSFHGPHDIYGRFIDARIDVHGKHAADVNPGEFADPDAYHIAVKLDKVGLESA